jgi:riboflavin kinase/FMN adenylyltransferase
VRVARDPGALDRKARAVAIGTFDGVHRGHRAVIDAALAAAREAGAEQGMVPTVVTFHPHPRGVVRGNQVELLSTLERRLELLADTGVEETLVVDFTQELSRLEPEEFAEAFLTAIGTRVLVAGEGFRFGRQRRGDLGLLGSLGIDARAVALREGVSSSAIRELLRRGEIAAAATLLGRPPELDGVVVAGDARGGRLGYPTANLRVEPDLLVPRFGIYAGAALGHRAAVSIGVNPHYGGSERRIEPFLLDFEGDLYGRRLVVELWAYLREEAAFGSEEALVEQIGRDVEATRAATRPA